MPDSGQLIEGKFELIEKIAEGGMAEIWTAKHKIINKKVAVKFLFPQFKDKESVYKRFEQEAKACASINHPNVVDIFDFGITDDQYPFIVMEFLEGQSLSAYLDDKGRMLLKEILDYSIQILSGLTVAHKKGIIHRDLKPANIFLSLSEDNTKIIKILDFGIAKIVDDKSVEKGITKTGSIFGTPFYMSPEQARGEKNLDQRIDIYSMGVILYECSTGCLPFVGETYNEIIYKVIKGNFIPLKKIRPDLPKEFILVVDKAMSYDRQERFESVLELKESLEIIKDNWNHEEEYPDKINMQSFAFLKDVETYSKTLKKFEIVNTNSLSSTSISDNNEIKKRNELRKKFLTITLSILVVFILGSVGFYINNKINSTDEISVNLKHQPMSENIKSINLPPVERDKRFTKIYLEGLPLNSKIFYDTKMINENPFSVNLDKNIHRITIQADGFETKALDVAADKLDLSIRIELNKLITQNDITPSKNKRVKMTIKNESSNVPEKNNNNSGEIPNIQDSQNSQREKLKKIIIPIKQGNL